MSAARSKTTKRKRKPASLPQKGDAPIAMLSGDRGQRLGAKHLCFSCGLKFYDLNRPEPICPRCKSNQRERPKESASKPAPPRPPEPRKPKPRDLGPLLEDEEAVPEEALAEEIDIDLGEIETEGGLFEETEEEPEPEVEEDEG
jgi:hypothetical protein